MMSVIASQSQMVRTNYWHVLWFV